MPVPIVQTVTVESTEDASTASWTWDTKPREGNTIGVIYSGDGGPQADVFANLTGYRKATDADNVTGAYAFAKTAGPDEPMTNEMPLEASVSHELFAFELTSTADDALDITARFVTAGAFDTTVSSGSTSPEWDGTSQADERVIVGYFRNGAGFEITDLADGLTELATLHGAGSHPTSMVIATAELTEIAAELEYVSGLSGGSLAPGGLLVTFMARGAGPVGRSLRQQYQEAPDALPIAITNTGTGTLDWTAVADQAWITLTPESGTAPSTLMVAVSALGLAPDSYDGTVTISAAGASDVEVPVSFEVGAEQRAVGLSLGQAYRVHGAVLDLGGLQFLTSAGWKPVTLSRLVEGVWI